ncbi:hypothetical protein VZT92_011450 [Zoarces viviparus]|uniref:Uncharacterized protein n=1 Tax=Zoarces viviparus TaxID=48416 RepID=A0AAW1F6C6_ZOAVI
MPTSVTAVALAESAATCSGSLCWWGVSIGGEEEEMVLLHGRATLLSCVCGGCVASVCEGEEEEGAGGDDEILRPAGPQPVAFSGRKGLHLCLYYQLRSGRWIMGGAATLRSPAAPSLGVQRSLWGEDEEEKDG